MWSPERTERTQYTAEMAVPQCLLLGLWAHCAHSAVILKPVTRTFNHVGLGTLTSSVPFAGSPVL